MKISTVILALGCFLGLGIDYAIASPLPQSVSAVEHASSTHSEARYERDLAKRDAPSVTELDFAIENRRYYRAKFSFAGITCDDIGAALARVGDVPSKLALIVLVSVLSMLEFL